MFAMWRAEPVQNPGTTTRGQVHDRFPARLRHHPGLLVPADGYDATSEILKD